MNKSCFHCRHNEGLFCRIFSDFSWEDRKDGIIIVSGTAARRCKNYNPNDNNDLKEEDENE